MKKDDSRSLMRLARRTPLFWCGAALLAALLPGRTAADLLPQTGQTACYDQSGSQLGSCAGTGQDGDSQAGVPWPADRFQLNGDATVTDTLTGLAWSKDANAPGPLLCAPGVSKTWPQALSYVKCLNAANYLGHSDWRLPNIKELWSLFNAGQGNLAAWLAGNQFDNVQTGRYKSSTASPGNLSDTPLVMNFGDGSTLGFYWGSADHVWPVRTAQTAGVLQPPQTGTTQCYDVTKSTVGSCGGTGQDGELQLGAPWSTATRFTVNDATVDDNLTGLQWVKSGRALSTGQCSGGLSQWGAALAFVQCLNDTLYLGKRDWRLPNLNELSSLSNSGSDTYTWLTTPPVGFDLDPDHSYWTSSTYLPQPGSAWSILFGLNGFQAGLDKTLTGNVLPVRTLPVTGFKVGDVNRDGVIDLKDAQQIYQLYLAPVSPVDPLADVAPLGSNGRPVGSGKIDLGDVVTILRYTAMKGNPGVVQW